MVEYFGLDENILKDVMKKNNLLQDGEYVFTERKVYGIKFVFDENKKIKGINLQLDGNGDYIVEIKNPETFPDVVEMCGFDNCIPLSHNHIIDPSVKENFKLINWEKFSCIIETIAKVTEDKNSYPVSDVTITECVNDDVKSEDIKYASVIHGNNKEKSSCFVYLDYRQLLNLAEILNVKQYVLQFPFDKIVESVIWEKELNKDISLFYRNYVKHNQTVLFANGIALCDRVCNFDDPTLMHKVKNSNNIELIDYYKFVYNNQKPKTTEEEMER